ncbi:MAG: hypothetical protein CM15mP18_2060 [Methanobacteriota archaeon]|nr:MAG: hypothetical protein CM15mP18_2060 [Euryarchaeota archaeon]
MALTPLEAKPVPQNVHDKVIIDATSIPSTGPRSGEAPLLGSFQATPEIWGRGKRRPRVGR